MRSEEDLQAALRTLERFAPDPDVVLREVRRQAAGRPRRGARRVMIAPLAAAAPGRRLRLAAPVIAAAAVIAVIATVAVVTAGMPGPHRTAVAGHRVTVGHGVSNRQRSRLDAEVIGLYFPATGAQFSTGAQLEGILEVGSSDIVARCMTKAGYPVPLTPLASAAADAAGFYDNTQFPDLGRISRTGMIAPQGGSSPGPLLHHAGSSRSRFNTDLARCQTAPLTAVSLLDRAGGTLGHYLLPMITRVQASAQVRATLPGLRSCAERHGWPANPYGPPATAINSFTDFADWVFGYLDGAGTRGASTATMLALNRRWARVFVQCGRPTIAVQERLQLARQRVFLRDHHQQVAALEARAVQLVTALEREYGAAGTG
jgi:hypothetical protein